MIYKFLFPSNPNSTGASLFLLILRVFFGLLFNESWYTEME